METQATAAEPAETEKAPKSVEKKTTGKRTFADRWYGRGPGPASE